MVKDHFSASLRKSLSYFSFFSYAPSLHELWVFFPIKMSFIVFKRNVLLYIESSRGIRLLKDRITLDKEGGIGIRLLEKNNSIALNKIRLFRSLERLFLLNPFIAYVGITGSVAANNAKEDDDIDIFVISYPQRLWVCRLITVVLLSLYGIRRSPLDTDVKDKICCNLWFDGSDLAVPEEKRSSFTAKEIVLMKPMISRPFGREKVTSSYQLFIQHNRWLFDYLPNISPSYFKKNDDQPRHTKVPSQWGVLGTGLNLLCMQFQKKIMRTPTTEYLSDTQLWFFPRDVSILLRKIGLT